MAYDGSHTAGMPRPRESAALGRDRGAPCAQHVDTAPTVAGDSSGAATPASEDRSAHSGRGTMSDHGSFLVASGHDCTRCPPSGCARMAPCASGPSNQSARAAVPAVMIPPVFAVREALPAQHAASEDRQPPTPPPQLAS